MTFFSKINMHYKYLFLKYLVNWYFVTLIIFMNSYVWKSYVCTSSNYTHIATATNVEQWPVINAIVSKSAIQITKKPLYGRFIRTSRRHFWNFNSEIARQSSFSITQHLTGPQLVERQMHWNIISKNYAVSLVRMKLLQIDHIPAIFGYVLCYLWM